jgi:hypothetical protein
MGMKRGLYLVPVLALFASLSASAATVEAVKGKVLINRGEGFLFCQIKVIPGRVVSVAKQPPCTAPYLVGEADDRWYSNGLVPFGITAAVGWGIFCAATYCRDEGGGGRRFNQQLPGSPASP